MNYEDFVYKSIYKGAIAKGATEATATAYAEKGEEDYKKGRIDRSVSQLIEKYINEAKRNSQWK